MATNFPTSLDSYTTKNAGDTIAEGHVNDLQSAVSALEVKTGVDSSAITSTIDYFLKHASGAYRTHIHDAGSDDGANIPLSSITDYPFKTGDWITSSVTTARTGWTNVSATYSDKFMRINATPLTTGGADTHTHAGPSHTHTLAPGANTQIGATLHKIYMEGGILKTADDGVVSTVTGNIAATAAGGTETTGSGNNVPAYVQVVIFQKD